MAKGYKKFKEGIKVKVAQCYLDDEVTQNYCTSETAIVFAEPNDKEQLVGIQYEGGSIDFAPQYILEVINPKK